MKTSLPGTYDALDLWKGTTVSVVADVLDRMGLRNQVMDHSVRPIVETNDLLVGRAHTIRAVADDSIPDNPYEHEIAAVDAVMVGDIVVIETGVIDASIWGELLATRAAQRGFSGAILDGGVRDLAGVRRIGRPTYARSVSANDSRGRVRVVEHGTPIVCGGVTVAPGDVVLADLDGVVVVPAEQALGVATAALAKLAAENSTRDSLQAGVSAAETYATYGVL